MFILLAKLLCPGNRKKAPGRETRGLRGEKRLGWLEWRDGKAFPVGRAENLL
jgi:hypothetical protein